MNEPDPPSSAIRGNPTEGDGNEFTNETKLTGPSAEGEVEEVAHLRRTLARLREAFDIARELAGSLDDLVGAVNPRNDNLANFALFLGAFVRSHSQDAGLRCRVDVPNFFPDHPLEASIRDLLYLATKEIVQSMAKHAGATEIQVSLKPGPSHFVLTIGDDGKAPDPGMEVLPDTGSLAALRAQLALHPTDRSRSGHLY